MAAKNKHKKKHTAPKINFIPANGAEEDEVPGDNSGEDGEPEGEPGPNRNKEKDEFNLDEVLRLGGTQGDFVLLAGVDESNELIDGGKKGAIDDLEDGELEKFITKLGIRRYSDLQIIAGEDETPAPNDGKHSKPQKPEKQQKETEKKTQNVTNKWTNETSATARKPKDTKKLKANIFEFTKRSVLLIKPGGKWFDNEYASEFSSNTQDASLVAKYKTLAQQLFENEVEIYRNKKNLQKGANSAWMKTVVSAGVLADRMAAMTVLIQDAPVHSLEHVENLVAMVKKKGSRRMGLMAMDTIRELILSDLLPENRKLRSFNQHPFDKLEEKASGNKEARDRRLVLWLFEHQLKHHFAEFVVTLETVAHDTVATTKMKGLMTAFELLSSRPEQEKALLVQVVNKLGDPEYKLAAKASYLLETLLHKHPNMKAVVCCEVERLMFRANVGAKAQYYAVCFLSQVILSHSDADLAGKLIGIYFSFFRACVMRQEVESRMLSALLTGVNRAYPFAVEGDEAVKEQMDTVFKVVHVVKFNTAVQALMLLFQVMDSQQSVSDRYYGALYRKLLDPGLASSSRQSMFLNLVYKSVKADTVLRRVKAFVKRLLQISSEQNSSFVCGALFLVSQLLRTRPGLRTVLQEQGDGEDEVFKDLPDEDDEEEHRRKTEAEEDDDEERFVDADKTEEAVKPEEPKPPAASWVHHQNIQGGKLVQSYDPLHRNPLFCGADHTALWELHKLAAHFHPSVSLFAKTILQGDSIEYSGDPLQDFTLIRFLDRFVFRNPKQLKGKQNTDSVKLQPKQKKPHSSLPVNCEEFLSKDESQIPVDEVFFHRYFRRRHQEQQTRRPRPDGDANSIEDVDDDEFEQMLDSCEGDSYFSQFKDDNLDFAGSVNRKKGDSSDSEDEEDAEDLDDEEVELSLDEEDFGDELEDEGGAFMDPDEDEDVPELEEDELGFEDSDEEELEEEPSPPQKKKNKRKQTEELDFSADFGPRGAKKKKKGKESAMFASAEEFGSLLDENAGSKFDNVGLNAMRNTDRAGLKQLKWETQRDDWIHGRDAKTLRRKKSTFNRKPFRRPQTGNRKLGAKKNRK